MKDRKTAQFADFHKICGREKQHICAACGFLRCQIDILKPLGYNLYENSSFKCRRFYKMRRIDNPARIRNGTAAVGAEALYRSNSAIRENGEGAQRLLRRKSEDLLE